MSLNGLDSVHVNQIYESTIAEAGGWFLLHYVTRDEVEVYKSGSGGLSEIREAIEQYEEKSPLYGLLVYRRKGVLLKYVPEGTSRLLQARLTVHLQSVIERFPHDTLLSLQVAAELTDTALSSSVSALKTSGSVRSLNSLKKRPLTEIAEDASEIPISDSQPSTPIETPISESHDQIPLSATSEQSIESEDKASTSTTKAIRGLGDEFVNNNDSVQRPSTAIDASELQRRPSIALSDSAQSVGSKSLHSVATPGLSASYLYKPKVKLAPRPIEEPQNSNSYVRSTSSLPAGVQLQSRERTIPSPIMRAPNSGRVTNFPLSPNDRYTNGFSQPLAPKPPPTHENRPISRGNIAVVPGHVRSNEESTITPEKKRLMKALQKRKQQQKARQLAREGKFDDEDMEDSRENRHANETRDFTNLNSGRSDSPRRLENISPTSEISYTDQAYPSDDHTATVDPSNNGEGTTISVADVIQSDSNYNEGDSPQEELLPSANTRSSPSQDPVFPTNGSAESINHTDDNLQHTVSVLQFPDWSNTREHTISQTNTMLPLPDTSEFDIKSYQPLILNLPQETALSNMDYAIDDETTSELQETGSILSAKMNPSRPVDPQAPEASNNRHENAQHDQEIVSHDIQEEPDRRREASGPAEQLLDPAPAFGITHSVNHNHEDDIQESPYETVKATRGAEEDPESDADATPVRTFENDDASTHASVSQHEEPGSVEFLPNRRDSATDLGKTQELNTSVDSRDAGFDSDLVVDSSPTDGQSRPSSATPVRHSASHSEAPSLSEEDSLLDELDSATVQEATSLKLPKTPPASFSPTFARQVEAEPEHIASANSDGSPNFPGITSSPSETSQQFSQRSHSLEASPISPLPNSVFDIPTTTTNPEAITSFSHSARRDNSSSNLPSLSTFVSGARQLSLSPPPGDIERPGSRKSAVSSLISQRIKAFEDKFSVPSSPQQTPTSAVKAQIVTLRKVSLNTPSQQAHSSSHAERKTASAYPTPSPSPHNLAQKLGFGKPSKKENPPKDATSKDKAMNDTISQLNQGVTDNSPSISVLPEIPATQPESRGMRSIFSSKSRKKRASGDPPSSSHSKDGRLSADASTSGNSVSPLSNNSSESVERTRAPSSTESLTSDGEKKDPKKRAGLLKRLSTMGSSTHRSIAETIVPVNEEAAVTQPVDPGTAKTWKSSVKLGELNIQFPDTLLWKRRSVEIDSQGFVVLAPSQAEKNSKAITKRYHVSDFKMPYVPEPDREELPYSVNLDFLDGSTIQCSCDSAIGQQRVYQALTAARNAFETA